MFSCEKDKPQNENESASVSIAEENFADEIIISFEFETSPPEHKFPAPTETHFEILQARLEAETYIEPQNPPEPEPEEIKTHKVRLAFVGDLMVHDRQMEFAYDPASDTYTFTHFIEIERYLSDADYTAGNLETTFSGKDAGYATYPLFNAPDSFAAAIKEAGFDFVTTANNHCYDKREAGMLRTLEVLDAHGLDHTGTFATEEDAAEIFINEINGIKIALLSYTYSTNGIPVAAGKPWQVNMLDEELMRRQIGEAREKADVVIVMPHMGNEYEERPSARYVNLAKSMCAWGADAVMAHHPHVLQPAEVFEIEDGDGNARTCFIAYSMGNFVSGQRTVPRDAGAIFYLEFEKTGDEASLTRASFTPTWVQFRNAKGANDVKVLPVYEVLTGEFEVRPQDLNRVREVHRENAKKFFNADIPLSEALPEYVLFSQEENTDEESDENLE